MLGVMKSIYLGDHRALLETVDNCMMFVDTRDMLIAPNLLVRNEWEADESALFRKLVRPGMTFVDVGANIGYYTLLAGRLLGPAGKAFAFEPDPHNFELLRRNVIVNAMQGYIETIPKAVYRRAEKLRFFARKYYPGNSSMAALPQSTLDFLYDEIEEMEVDAVSLDEFFPGNARIDVVKVDVEGAEPGVFAGMRDMLKRNRSVVVLCEWCPGQMTQAGNDPEELLKELRDQGLTPRCVERSLGCVDFEDLARIPYCNLLLKRG
jgi:FkbM family methyltransferase